MPSLDTDIHLDMLRRGKERLSLSSRIKKALKIIRGSGEIYGLEWGDPDFVPPLMYVRDHFLKPYLDPNKTVLEIGAGGGRWTRYMLNVKKIYVVDYYQEVLNEHKSNFKSENIIYIKNNGNDFPKIQDESIDFLFSFGVFVHLDIDIIDSYLRNMKQLLNHSSNVVIQYSDMTKPMGRERERFSKNDPDTMRKLVLSHGYSIYEEDTKTMWHSSIIRFGLPKVTT